MERIEYAEIYDATTFKLLGVVDLFNSIIWHTCYYDIGDFEIYCNATEKNAKLLKRGNWVKTPISDEIAIIEAIETTYSAQDGYMLVVTGRMATSILDRRLIYQRTGNRCYPALVSGNVQTAINLLINFSMINPSNPRRRWDKLSTFIESASPAVITDETGARTERQVTYENLSDYVVGLLKEYGLGAKMKLLSNGLQYVQYVGKELGLVFSTEFDNLVSSNYTENEQSFKNVALVSGAETQDSQGNTVKPQTTILYDSAYSGLERRELYVDGSSIDAYKEEENAEGEREKYDEATYQSMLQGLGMTKLAEVKNILSLSGVINVVSARERFRKDYNLGDTVFIEDSRLKVRASTRILEATEVQDENGYNIDLVYGV